MSDVPEYEVAEIGCWLPRAGAETSRSTASRRSRRLFVLLRGPIPKGTVLGRSCGDHDCLNPEHFLPLTPAEAAQRGRSAKLTPGEVRKVRLLRAKGMPAAEVARIFGVDESAISHITTGRRWRWVR